MAESHSLSSSLPPYPSLSLARSPLKLDKFSIRSLIGRLFHPLPPPSPLSQEKEFSDAGLSARPRPTPAGHPLLAEPPLAEPSAPSSRLVYPAAINV